MRMIDADALKDYYVNLSTEKDIGYGDMGRMITVNINHIIKTIDDAPSIDIVRCQDCKYWVYHFNGCSRNPCTEPWYATDFCNYGEREGE